MKKFLCAVILVATFAGGPAGAQDGKAPFLPPDAIDLAAVLPAPPTQDGAMAKAEIAEIYHAQAAATAAEKAQAVADSQEGVFLFANILGPDFAADKLPLAAKFFQSVGKSEGEFVNPAKKIFNRPRPPLADATITPCEKLTGSAAYPSGHATSGYLHAVVLAQMIPEKREAIFARAAEFAHNRIICGVHYPTDIEAGKISGFVIGAMLLENSAFRDAFAPAKAEVRKALGLTP